MLELCKGGFEFALKLGLREILRGLECVLVVVADNERRWGSAYSDIRPCCNLLEAFAQLFEFF